MSRYWSKLVSGLSPYVPGEQPQHDRLVKLNTNENPYPPSPAVTAAIRSINDDVLRLYPDPQSLQLREALAQRSGLAVEEVFVGNGSDEVLAFVFQALLQQDKPIAFPDVTYSFYPVWAEWAGVSYRTVALRDDFRIAVEDYPADCGGVILPNPNAPTGILLSLAEIESLLQQVRDAVVVIDEAYIDFGGDSAVSLVNEYDNLLVVQTVSKSRSLAGMRVGMAYGHEDLIEALNRVKNSFNSYPLDIIAQQATLASVRDEPYFAEQCEKVMATRGWLTAQLQSLGFDVLPSAANFVFARHPEREAAELFEHLRRDGIIVRYFAKPRIDQFLRITVGTQEQCEHLVTALEDMLAA